MRGASRSATAADLIPAGEDRLVNVSTWASLAPLALPDLPDEIGHRLVARAPARPEALLAARCRRPRSRRASPRSSPARWRTLLTRRYWRGPTWINSAWLLWIGLLRLGYGAEAERIAEALCSAYAREGSREFYEPFTGEGLGAYEFGWSTLIAELADPDAAAADSYL